jgi:nucleoprotein TPR
VRAAPEHADLRKTSPALQEKIQTLESADNNVEFRGTDLEQEIKHLCKNAE